MRTKVLRGSGAAGQQFAQISFTNIGRASCVVLGFPGVSLRLAGAALAQPAQRSNKPFAAVTLAAGKTATTTLTDYSSCNAQNSDTIRIYPPNQTRFVDTPMVLRGCRLVVDPLTLEG